MASLLESLEAEQALRTAEGLCIPIDSDTGARISVDHDELLFGTSEYCKDGLLSIYERYGGELIGTRLLTLVDALIAESRHQTKYGPIPGGGAEINGNLLQLCGRLSYATGDPNAGRRPGIAASAYTNSRPGAATTKLFHIDAARGVLAFQDPPNDGVQVSVGPLGAPFGALAGFEILTDSAGRDWGYAAAGGLLYGIDLATGAATALGPIGAGGPEILSLTSAGARAKVGSPRRNTRAAPSRSATSACSTSTSSSP